MNGNVEFKSNLYPVEGSLMRDKNFLRRVHDIFALERLSELCAEGKIHRLDFTPLQREEYRNASGHCKYAEADDYPWGTIVRDGVERVVCRCSKVEACEHPRARECRKYFEPLETIEPIEAIPIEKSLIEKESEPSPTVEPSEKSSSEETSPIEESLIEASLIETSPIESARLRLLDGWIANIFFDYAEETIDRKKFLARHAELYPESDEALARERWTALVGNIPARRRYEVEEILRAPMPNAKTSAPQNEGRRQFTQKKFRNGSSFLDRIEVGLDGDVDETSFASDAEVQEFIRRELRAGMSIGLIKNPSGTRPFVSYRLLIEEPQWMEFGCTGRNFAVELEQTLRRVLDVSGELEPKLFPSAFDDVFVNGITSCVSSDDVSAARRFGSMRIWSGVSIEGFARAKRVGY